MRSFTGMHIENLYQPFEIEMKRSDACPVRRHAHTYFEMVYIWEGEGVHHINGNRFDYFAQNLFLLMPLESHHFEVQTTTTFLFIRFNNIYLKAQKAAEQHADLGSWIQKLEYVFQNSNHLQGCIIRNRQDRPLVRTLVEAISLETEHQQTFHKELVQHLINSLMTLVARNIALHTAEKTRVSHPVSLDIIHYIHLNIYNPAKLKAEAIAAHFSISLNYLSEYFKKHTGENLQQYIIQYKLSLVEIRLRHSDMRLNEIAYELGFTDESHLTKTFKKYRGLTPSEYRKGALAIAS
jgi:AraC-like DNA-binding protein